MTSRFANATGAAISFITFFPAVAPERLTATATLGATDGASARYGSVSLLSLSFPAAQRRCVAYTSAVGYGNATHRQTDASAEILCVYLT